LFSAVLSLIEGSWEFNFLSNFGISCIWCFLNIVRSLFVVGGKHDTAILALIDEFVSLVLTFWIWARVFWKSYQQNYCHILQLVLHSIKLLLMVAQMIKLAAFLYFGSNPNQYLTLPSIQYMQVFDKMIAWNEKNIPSFWYQERPFWMHWCWLFRNQ
jgi:hypothetical protein